MSLLLFLLMSPTPPRSTLFPYTTLFRSRTPPGTMAAADTAHAAGDDRVLLLRVDAVALPELAAVVLPKRVSAEHRTVGALLIRGVLRGRRRRSGRRHPQRRNPRAHR